MAAVTDPIIFFAARTTDGTSTAYPFLFPNKRGQLSVYGTWDGATMTLYSSPDSGTTYVVVKDAVGNDLAFTSDRSIIIEAPVGEKLRCVLSNDGASTSLTAKLEVM